LEKKEKIPENARNELAIWHGREKRKHAFANQIRKARLGTISACTGKKDRTSSPFFEV